MKTWKRKVEMQDGINWVVRILLARANDSSRQARQYLAGYRAGHDWQHAEWIRYREERAECIYFVRRLLEATTNGVVTEVVANRVHARWKACYEARKAAEKGETPNLQPTTPNPQPAFA